MKLPEITQIAFQGAAQASPFQPVQIPDPNPRLQANLATIARSFQNIETSGVQQYKQQEMQAKQMEQLYEFAPKAIQSIYKIQDEAREASAKAFSAQALLDADPAKLKEALSAQSERNRELTPEQQIERDALIAKEGREISKEPGNSELASLFVGAVGKERNIWTLVLLKCWEPFYLNGFKNNARVIVVRCIYLNWGYQLPLTIEIFLRLPLN